MKSIEISKHLMSSTCGIAILVFLSFFTTPAMCVEESETVKARDIYHKWQDVVVPVKIVIRERFVMKGVTADVSERNIEAIATVIDPNGLAVAPFSSFEPSRVAARMFAEENMDDSGVKTEITSIKMVLPGNTETPAKIVLKDSYLDLVLIRPIEKPAKPLSAIDLSDNTRLDILDHVVIVSRLEEVVNYIPLVSLSHIQAIIEKPRRLYIPCQNDSGFLLGSPVFSINGKVAGILMLKLSQLGIMPILLPAQDIMEVVEQVP